MKTIPKVLFLCTGNSCRSQMAEGWVRKLLPGDFEPFSAGTAPQELDPRAVRVMAERGVDLSGQRSKDVAGLSGIDFDLVVTVCDNARQNCPMLPGEGAKLHAGFEDPPRLAAGSATEGEALEHYRRVRDEIGTFVKTLPRLLESERFESRPRPSRR